MGYVSRLRGELVFSPALPHKDTVRIERVIREHNVDIFALDTYDDETETDEGLLVQHRAEAIMPASEDRFKCYSALDQIQTILYEVPTDIEVTGEIIREGETAGDISRFVAVRSETGRWYGKEEQAIFTWPDGTKVSVR